jgi:hypothetical protein
MCGHKSLGQKPRDPQIDAGPAQQWCEKNDRAVVLQAGMIEPPHRKRKTKAIAIRSAPGRKGFIITSSFEK